MPVLVRGTLRGAKELRLAQKIGFTGSIQVWGAGIQNLLALDGKIPGAPEAHTADLLDHALKTGWNIQASLQTGKSWTKSQKTLLQVARDSKLANRAADGLYLKLQQLCYESGLLLARQYAGFPALQWTLIHAESRDTSQPSFNEIDKQAYKQFSGRDIPPEVKNKSGVSYQTLPDFPADRVIADDNPIYTYYKWYWQTGDGWNILNKKVVEGLQAGGGERIKTYSDPAARVASVYGSSASTDYIGQWTYVYPDPINISLATDELLTMASGPQAAKHHQKVIGGPQIIMYRDKVTQNNKAVGGTFDDHDFGPGDRFITVPPTLLSEAVWSNLARPVGGFYFHGWYSLVPGGGPERAYKYTNPQTQQTLSDLIHDVIQPLGPALLQVPDVKSDVAYLESFASQMLAGRGTYGWARGWGSDAYLVLLYAQLQPHVVYDQTIRDGGLDGCKVLVLADCDVLTRQVVEKIKAFQSRGGIVVADERCCPAIAPDVLMPSYERTKKADKDKAALLQRAAKLRSQLSGQYNWMLQSDNPQVITRRRQFGAADYLFVVNDHRTFGHYIGQHGLVMEDGLPSNARITFRDNEGAVFDLLTHQPLKVENEGGQMSFNVKLGPGEGRIFAVLDSSPAKLAVNAPAEVKRGASIHCDIALLDGKNQAVQAVVPMQVKILDPAGHEAEYSGYYGAVGGKLALNLDIAPNDRVGVWRVEVQENISGLHASTSFEVR
jgi:hypothetical protein